MMKRMMNKELGIRILKMMLLYSLFLIPYSVNAQSVDLLWQGETYTPPFYKGRALWSSHSNVTFLAIPHDLGNPENLNYKWSRNGTVLGLASGVGINTLTFSDRIISKPQIIKVEIVSPEQEDALSSIWAETSVTITPRLPSLIIYENNPLYGFMFHRETGERHELQEREATLTAFPLFFSALNRNDSMIGYEWRANPGEITDAENSVTYRAPDGTDGLSAISVHALHKDTDKFLQNASKSFLIQFGK